MPDREQKPITHPNNRWPQPALSPAEAREWIRKNRARLAAAVASCTDIRALLAVSGAVGYREDGEP